MIGDKESRRLAPNVLAVAVEGAMNDWAVYICAVSKELGGEELKDIVAREGSKVYDETLAYALFPSNPWKKLSYRG